MTAPPLAIRSGLAFTPLTKAAEKRGVRLEQSKRREAAGGSGAGTPGWNELATTLRLLLDEPSPSARRVLLEKLLEELGQAVLTPPVVSLNETMMDLSAAGRKLAERYDAGESGLLTSEEFRVWTERVVTLLTAMNPAEPVMLPDRPQFWV